VTSLVTQFDTVERNIITNHCHKSSHNWEKHNPEIGEGQTTALYTVYKTYVKVHSGHLTFQSPASHYEILLFPHIVYLCVSFDTHNEHRLLPGWYVYGNAIWSP